VPDKVSHYRIDAEIGRGGMGVVYSAHDTRLGRAVAIKMLPAEATADPDRHRRFIQEARAASALNHPHIVTIHDIDEDNGTTFIAMELVDGTRLDTLIAGGPLPVARALEVASQIASALDAAHGSGIVHRDIKPANILITRDGRAKVLDFGLAKLVERGETEDTMTGLDTRPGLIMGTAAYMSPEQAEGRPVTARSDIFSLGAVLYEMLSGRRPFAANSDLGLITSILRDHPPALRSVRPDVPADVQAMVDRCIAKDPDTRYAEARALKADLDAAHEKLTRPADQAWRRPAVLIPVALVVIAGVAFGGWQTVQARRLRWVQQVAIPEIERLQMTDNTLDALRLARQAARFAPGEIDRVRLTWYPLNLETEPTGASVEIRNYLDTNGTWERLGETPLRGQFLPFGFFHVRVTKEGYAPAEITMAAANRRVVTLEPAASTPARMVLVTVPGNTYAVGIAKSVPLADYWIDKFEVTNGEFKQFVDAGGYRDQKYWTEPFHDGARVLSVDDALARFRDSTGRPGPAAWQLGSFPDGQADFPVGGISWFEATAYANFSGKRLPTIYHWYRAANPEDLFSDILRSYADVDAVAQRGVDLRGGLLARPARRRGKPGGAPRLGNRQHRRGGPDRTRGRPRGAGGPHAPQHRLAARRAGRHLPAHRLRNRLPEAPGRRPAAAVDVSRAWLRRLPVRAGRGAALSAPAALRSGSRGPASPRAGKSVSSGHAEGWSFGRSRFRPAGPARRRPVPRRLRSRSQHPGRRRRRARDDRRAAAHHLSARGNDLPPRDRCPDLPVAGRDRRRRSLARRGA
jgi:predicted Ser/Thr protein kinase